MKGVSAGSGGGGGGDEGGGDGDYDSRMQWRLSSHYWSGVENGTLTGRAHVDTQTYPHYSNSGNF